MGRADIVGTGRDESLINAMVAEVALVGDVKVMVIGDGIIGTGVDTRLTSGAQVVIHDDSAVIPLGDRLIRTNVRAGGIVAMTAQVHPEAEFHFIVDQVRAIFFYPDQFNSVRRPIFLLACHLAGFAAPAKILVYSYFKFIHVLFL
jgi:hypothetical protein